MRAITLLLLAVVSFSSCSKNRHDSSGDYLITGQTGGFVMAGIKADFFKVGNGTLTEDTSQSYFAIPEDVNKFNFNVLLDQSRYDRVKDMIAVIPTELYSMNNAAIGMPMVDAGYTDVRARVNGTMYKWRFEANQASSSAAVQQFVHRLQYDFYQ